MKAATSCAAVCCSFWCSAVIYLFLIDSESTVRGGGRQTITLQPLYPKLVYYTFAALLA